MTGKIFVLAAVVAGITLMPDISRAETLNTPLKESKRSMEDITIQYAQHADLVMRKEALESVQDELVMLSSLVMQDALADQRMQDSEVVMHKARIESILCAESSGVCDRVRANLSAIVSLYGPSKVSDQEVNSAVTGLMSEVVGWLARHPLAISLK